VIGQEWVEIKEAISIINTLMDERQQYPLTNEKHQARSLMKNFYKI